jgi:nucleoside phosphorylase
MTGPAADRGVPDGTPPEVRVGIVTALPIECAAVRLLVDDLREQPAPDDPHHYRSGWMPSTEPDRPHRVVIALQTDDGTRNAAASCAHLARSFPGLTTFVMCGIAGGFPAPEQPQRHVRLGDIVVATKGIVDYDHVRTVDGVDTLRRPVEGLSKALLRADHELEMQQLDGREPWRAPLAEAVGRAELFGRPGEETDLLFVAGGRAAHPDRRRSGHPRGWPRVHRGAVGSADRLLRDAARRDELADRYGIRAVEMEGSGIAVGADLHDRRWFMVRGIADYCDNRTKNDVWHPYAALAAAAYVRALLAQCHPFGVTPVRTAGPAATVTPDPRQRPAPALGPADGLAAIVDALLGLRPMRDDFQRRAILDELPDHIRTAVPASATGRLHVIGLVRTCEDFPGGADALLTALRLALGAASPEYLRVERVIRDNWSGR